MVASTENGRAYYNENNQFAAAWLRELIKENLICPGDVDERSIEEVKSDDLVGYTQHHFFAGIGTWSHALRRAGWADTRPVWTGSCPCQPFSAAGKRKGFGDERHLWPEWFRLIRESKPDVIFGEQVASKNALIWFDTVSADLEGEGYAIGAIDSCAAGVGAPHIRQRLYFVGHSAKKGLSLRASETISGEETCSQHQRSSHVIGLADSGRERSAGRGDVCDVGEAKIGNKRKSGQRERLRNTVDNSRTDGDTRGIESGGVSSSEWQEISADRITGATNGFWAGAIWLPCRDGKARPTKPGIQPLAHGTPNRVGTLRGAGNSIVAPQAQAFIECYMELSGK